MLFTYIYFTSKVSRKANMHVSFEYTHGFVHSSEPENKSCRVVGQVILDHSH